MSLEIKIAVPWGEISGKVNGSDGEVVLCLHGIQDNLNTFDRLIPLLPKGFQYIAFDFPGHGKSSPFPLGLPLVYMHFTYSVKLVVDFYKLDKVILLGHSFGAQTATVFAAVYPEYCQKIILLDGIIPLHIETKDLFNYYRQHFDEAQKIDQKLASKEPPSYMEEQALTKLIDSRLNNLTRDSAQFILKRSLVKSRNGVRFGVDQRLKTLVNLPLNKEEVGVLIDCIECPCLLIVSKDTINESQSKEPVNFSLFIKNIHLAQKLPNFNFDIVEGNHYVHINNPERVSDKISHFLLFTKCSL